MVRLGLASTIAALSLLTWVATASAECAWVLWSTTRTGTSTSTYARGPGTG